ncbi:MAG TPA: divergent polysaccharide deacetylase family protein [Acetobacteraceae bacterium]|nr:divergent polysaccharide deacetylase family protein [Acetobacteraceae bacterium]
MLSGWRGLGVFWGMVLVVLIGGALVLQTLGPPVPPRLAGGVVVPPRAATAPTVAPLVSQRAAAIPSDRPGRDTPGPVADPDPALLEPGPGGAGAMLPKIAEDGRRPSQVYAAGFDPTTLRPRIGILVAGIGLDRAASEKAIRDLPGGVTLAVSPYSAELGTVLGDARLAGHEYLLSVPMEPQGFPQNDPGSHALMTDLSATDNLDRLRWLMARVQGYVGITNALGALRGERFAGMPQLMAPVLAEAARRGLLYVDARPPGEGGQAVQNQVWSVDTDLVVDGPPEQIDAKLGELQQLARERGEALGLATGPSPIVVQHIAAWANGLMDRGLVLAPVSALVRAPAQVAVSR